MQPGTIVIAKPDPVVVGRELAERRPVLVVSAQDFSEHIPDLVIAVPLTTRDRGLPHHVPVRGLAQPSWALCEQLRAVSTARLGKVLAVAEPHTLAAIRRVITVFLDL